MAESRDQTLIDFQAVTGIDDFDLCTNILTQHDWNLERAVNNVMGFGPTEGSGNPADDIGPSPATLDTEGFCDVNPMGSSSSSGRPSDHGASEMASGPSYSTSPLNFSSRQIFFNVEYRDKNITVVLPDSETVGKIKETLEEELGIPRDKQELKGLVKRKVDDSTVIRNLYLPRENSLYLLTPQIRNPTVNKVDTNEGEGTSQGLEDETEYTLKISYKDGSRCKQFNINFDRTKSVGEVKHSISVLTDVPARLQKWSGWPRRVTDQDKLFVCGLNYPSHELEMSKSESTATSSSRTDQSEEMEVDLDSDDDDNAIDNTSLEDDLFGQDEPSSYRSPQPLMPDNVTDDKDALEHFSNEFTNRYGECHPHFFIGTLDDAIQQSLAVKATERKLLAIYLHHDNSVFANVFCSQLMCAEVIVNFLSNHFVTWAWDLTYPSNTARLLQSATRHFGGLAANQMRLYKPEQLPSLLLISRSKATNEVIDVIQGHITLDEMMTRLYHALDVFQPQKQADISEEMERDAREQIKQEQDAAYRESLATDRKKAEVLKVEQDKRREEMEREMEIQKKEEDKKKEAVLIKEAISQSVATSVPPEPPADDKGSTCSLRFRPPNREIFTRRFYAENTIKDLLNYLISKGFHTEDYKVLTTYPRRDITMIDTSDSLESSKLCPQETLILEER